MTTQNHISVTIETTNGGSTTVKMPLQPDQTKKHGWRLRHAKNYIGVPLAVALDGDTGAIIEDRLVGMTREAINGARALSLITDNNTLTELGEAFVTACETSYGSIDEAMGTIESSTYKRLTDATEKIAPAIHVIMAQYPPVAELITVLNTKTTPEEGYTLPDLVPVTINNGCGHFLGDLLSDQTPPYIPEEIDGYQHEEYSTLQSASTPDLSDFTDSEDDKAEKSKMSSNVEANGELYQQEFYAGTYTHHFKSILYHTGILTENGSDSSSFEAEESIWKLDPKLTDEARETADIVTPTKAWEN